MKEVKIPNVFYYYIHSKIWERTKGNSIQKSELKGYLAEWRIPKNLRYLIIKELEILGLIKKTKKHQIEFEKPKFNDEEILKKFNVELGIF